MMYIFLTGFVLCLVAAVQPGLLDVALNEVPETDDDRLNQALLLVDILKSEYVKLLRERNVAPGLDADASPVEQSTCATTVGEASTGESLNLTKAQSTEIPVSSSATLPSIPGGHPLYPQYPALLYTAAAPYSWGWPMTASTAPSRRFYDMMPQPPQPLYPMFPQSRRIMRPNFPDYSYFYVVGYAVHMVKRPLHRRSDYYDEHREEKATEISRSTSSATTAAASSRQSTRTTSAPVAGNRRRFNTLFRRSNYQNRRMPDEDGQNTNIPAANAKRTSERVSQNPTSTTRIDKSTTDITTLVASRRKMKLLQKIKPKVPPQNVMSVDKWPAFLFKSTLRVFLENSTPLPIPLPENNAFCFTNPRNPMCRSP